MTDTNAQRLLDLRPTDGRGVFLVLEGLDGAGTTTQSHRLAAFLRDLGFTAIRTFQPSPRPIGLMIRKHLREPEHPPDPRMLALLFAADRLDHVAAEIEPALARGEIVVCDRYLPSSWAYQSLDCDLAWVREINSHAPWPDLTAVLTLAPETAAERMTARSQSVELFDAIETQRRVAATYSKMIAMDLPGVVEINAEAPIDEVSTAIVEACVMAFAQRCGVTMTGSSAG